MSKPIPARVALGSVAGITAVWGLGAGLVYLLERRLAR
jgi:hypothetical protein